MATGVLHWGPALHRAVTMIINVVAMLVRGVLTVLITIVTTLRWAVAVIIKEVTRTLARGCPCYACGEVIIVIVARSYTWLYPSYIW